MTSDSKQRRPAMKQALLIVLVLLAGLAIGAVVLRGTPASSAANEHDHEGHAEEKHADASAPKKGPHGGRLFTEGDYGLELTMATTGAESRFRAYTFRSGQPADPAQSRVTATVERLGRAPQVVAFTKEGDHLTSTAAIDEPHSFTVAIAAESAGQTHRFDHEQSEGRVAMSDEQLRTHGVQVATAGPARIRTELLLQGEVRLNGDRTVHVVPRLTGLVESVSVNAGDKVSRGQLLAVMASPSLADQRSEHLAAQKRLGLARTSLAREKMLWEDKISAEQDFLQARHAVQEAEIAEQSARQKLASLGAGATATASAAGQLTRYEIRAPIDGVITEKKISVGEVLKDDAVIFVVADLSTVWVEMTVYAKDLNTVRAGQPASVMATSFNAGAEGRVAYVGALVGEQTRAATARVVLPNPSGLWRPGLPVNVTLTAEDVEVPLAISVDALQSWRDGNVVFGRYGDQFEARPVELGRRDGQRVEVTRGLAAGERYAAGNSYLIKADLGKAGAGHEH